uniref:Uncharacterized protein n=1 Tax=Triticum urartu TaxID=4572 RepID=A0A8R7PCT0_TRIUA
MEQVRCPFSHCFFRSATASHIRRPCTNVVRWKKFLEAKPQGGRRSTMGTGS